MIWKCLATVAVSMLILAGLVAPSVVASQAQPRAEQPQAQPQQAPQPRSVTGKITSVSGQAFSVEVGEGNNKQTMEFVTDANTAKSGDLKVGSTATVQYRSGAGGQNTATKVDVQG